ncbi:MAG: hypothetical protein ACLS5I_15270 [Bacteroides fragilis]
MKQIPNNKATMSNKATAKQTKKQRKAEADARRRTNKRWERVETSYRYRKAAAEELCNVTTNKIEILDGILLNLNIRSQVKPSRVQDRILRRIVEKRQAQASHKKHGRSEDLTTVHITLTCTSKCMEDIRKKRHAA